MGEFEAKDQRMVSYLKEVEILKCQFKKLEISYVSRGSNSQADSLATLASTMAGPLPRIVSVELLPFSSLIPSNNGLVLSIHSSTSWMDPIVDLRKQLHYTKVNLATKKQLVTELREELKKAREAVQLVKEVVEAEKQVAYTLGVEKTQARLTEELTAVYKDYCSISWGKALDAAKVPVGSDLRRPESIYYDPEIRKLPSLDSSHPEQATQVSAQPKTDQVPPAPSEVPKSSNQDGGQGKKTETLKGKDKDQEKKKNSSDPREKAPDIVAPQLGQTVDPVVSTTKA